MEYKQSLSRRIVFAFVLMTAAVGGLFSVGIVGVVHIVEERLISRDLGGELDRIINEDLGNGQAPKLDPGMRFFISDGQGSYAMPPALDQLDVGFHEVFEGDLSFHALVRDIDGRRFVLLQDQSDFEAREQVLYASVLTGYVLSIALAGLLGWMLARKVMEPVVRLARQVRHSESCSVWRRRWRRTTPTTRSASWPLPSTRPLAACATRSSASNCSPATSVMSCVRR